jgi:hypothetical protein
MKTEDEVPSIEQMMEELNQLGWKKFAIDTWKSPNGALWLGPYKAWTIATAQKSTK